MAAEGTRRGRFLARGSVREVPAAAELALVAVEVARSVPLAGADRVLCLRARGVALLSVAGSVAGVLVPSRVLARKGRGGAGIRREARLKRGALPGLCRLLPAAHSNSDPCLPVSCTNYNRRRITEKRPPGNRRALSHAVMLASKYYMRSWQVREMTSSCCSRVRSMNFTA